ncbi:MAG TPA: hypothetical protein VFH78_08050 [Candidatus Thermoplasmatota archaeon]|nr:hypothetical protein [Candidatus Thermoplasmatota archaeon]
MHLIRMLVFIFWPLFVLVGFLHFAHPAPLETDLFEVVGVGLALSFLQILARAWREERAHRRA